MNLGFSERAWDEYLDWQNRDIKTTRKINQLLKDTKRNPFDGIGKPEPLRGNLRGFWSRRIDDANRLVYRVKGDVVEILSCQGHYTA